MNEAQQFITLILDNIENLPEPERSSEYAKELKRQLLILARREGLYE